MADDHPMPEDPRRDPGDALDAIEERVLGAPCEQRREEPDGPAHEQDINPEDTTAEHGGHPAGESPA